jgi:hypothetical protein
VKDGGVVGKHYRFGRAAALERPALQEKRHFFTESLQTD